MSDIRTIRPPRHVHPPSSVRGVKHAGLHGKRLNDLIPGLAETPEFSLTTDDTTSPKQNLHGARVEFALILRSRTDGSTSEITSGSNTTYEDRLLRVAENATG